MNRRQFFYTIGIIPFVGLLAKHLNLLKLQPLSLREALLADESYHLELALRDAFAKGYAELLVAEERDLFRKFWYGDGKIKRRLGRIKS